MTIPSVQLLADGLDPEVEALLAARLEGSFRLIPSSLHGDPFHAPMVADVVLLNLDRRGATVDDYAGKLRNTIEQARQSGASIVWFGTPVAMGGDEIDNRAATDVMDRAGVTVADFPGCIDELAAKSPEIVRQRTVDYFTEALGQWWAVCARSNPDALRIPLWPGPPPEFERSGAERINRQGRVDRISEPELTRFFPGVRGRGTAIIVFPGGGYGFTGFLRNARELAAILAPRGIPVFGLKYRTGRGAEIPLLDAARAVRLVRSRATEWGIHPQRLGVAGISAGAHLALNLATHVAGGDPGADDPVERVANRPDFVAAFSVWNFGGTESPFAFGRDVPPVFLRHARDDPAFALAQKVVAQLAAAKVPHAHRFLDEGGHGAFDLAPGHPGAGWPDDFLAWSECLPGPVNPAG